jgi:hypothetical protein
MSQAESSSSRVRDASHSNSRKNASPPKKAGQQQTMYP